MTHDEAYAALLAHLKQTEALAQTARLLSWDQETMMPAKGAGQRAEQAAALEAVLHTRRTDPRIPEWIDALDGEALDVVGDANVRETRRVHARATRVPTALAQELARTTASAQAIWAEARQNERTADFLPTLGRIVDLVRDRAECLADNETSRYDALLEDYEPGATETEISAIFGRLRAGLTRLRAAIAESPRQAPDLAGTFAKGAQLRLARTLASTFCYDWDAGRLDLSVHPFTAGSRGDSRITTRVDAFDPFNCMYSTIHETGHALYEQGLDPDLAWQPAGASVSMGIHESQSRYCENQIGRSIPFMEWLLPRMQEAFGNIGVATPGDLALAVNKVTPGFIRTEADEIHYNLHIMLRFELERALISGDLQVTDLEAAWNDRFAQDFGRTVPHPSQGVLQDVHWAAGLFGYFPTYTLGNIYAGELHVAMQEDIPDMEDHIRQARLEPLIAWLRANVHEEGSIMTPRDLMIEITGTEPDEQPLLVYLEEKFGALYDL